MMTTLWPTGKSLCRVCVVPILWPTSESLKGVCGANTVLYRYGATTYSVARARECEWGSLCTQCLLMTKRLVNYYATMAHCNYVYRRTHLSVILTAKKLSLKL